MAEALARATASRSGIAASVTFGSAGIAVEKLHSAADPRAIACVAQHGLDLMRHKTRAADAYVLGAADRIYALDRGVRDHLQVMAPAIAKPRIRLLMSLVPSLSIEDVEDPWYGAAADYEMAFGLINQAVTALDAELRAGQRRR